MRTFTMHVEPFLHNVKNYTIDLFSTAGLLKAAAASLAAIVGSIIEGNETIIALILVVYLIDFFTGVAKALKRREFSSAKFFKGAVKLGVYGILMLIGAGLDKVLHTGEVFLAFFFAYIFITDAISVLENLEEFGYDVPVMFVKYLRVRRARLINQFQESLSEEEREILERAERIKGDHQRKVPCPDEFQIGGSCPTPSPAFQPDEDKK